MQARVVEFMLSCWLTARPFIFHLSDSARALCGNNRVAAICVGGVFPFILMATGKACTLVHGGRDNLANRFWAFQI